MNAFLTCHAKSQKLGLKPPPVPVPGQKLIIKGGAWAGQIEFIKKKILTCDFNRVCRMQMDFIQVIALEVADAMATAGESSSSSTSTSSNSAESDIAAGG